LENHDISGQIDDRNEKTGKKIRDAELKKIPFMLVVGENEEKEGTISVRRRGEGDLGVMKLEDFVAYFKKKQPFNIKRLKDSKTMESFNF
jgi:threonyl-tRNA synthetase